MNLQNLSVFLDHVWPILAIVVACLMLWRVTGDLRPITTSVVNGIAANAQRQSVLYAYGILLALGASLQEVIIVAKDLNFVYVAAIARVLQPAVVVVIPIVAKYVHAPTPPTGDTKAPFPSTT